jgi:hypothetical protein
MSDGIVINVRTNFPEVVAKLNQVSEQISGRVMVRAINATITQGKTEMARDISKEFRIKVGEAKARLDITSASSKGGVYKFEASLQATKKGKGRSMNVIAFVTALPKRSKKGKLSQVKFQIRRSGPRKSVTGAFIGNKGRTLFVREGKARLPIKAVSTIDIPQMFNTKRINTLVQKVMLEKFEANIDRQLRILLEGFAK